jgi:hypothetical protein
MRERSLSHVALERVRLPAKCGILRSHSHILTLWEVSGQYRIPYAAISFSMAASTMVYPIVYTLEEFVGFTYLFPRRLWTRK